MKFYLSLFILLCLLSGCGSAKSSEAVVITSQPGPNGTVCYVIYQGQEAKGGNCQ